MINTAIFSKKVAVFSILFFVCTIFCTPVVLADEFDEDRYSIDTKIEVSYPKFEDISNKEIESKINNDVKQYVHQNLRDIQEFLYEDFSTFFDIDYDVKSKSEEKISFVMKFSTYTGGAHGNVGIKTFNYDLKTGKELSLKDVSNISIKEINKEIFKQAPGLYQDFKGITEYPSNFYQDKYGKIVIIFAPYEIAPYAVGIIEIKI